MCWNSCHATTSLPRTLGAFSRWISFLLIKISVTPSDAHYGYHVTHYGLCTSYRYDENNISGCDIWRTWLFSCFFSFSYALRIFVVRSTTAARWSLRDAICSCWLRHFCSCSNCACRRVKLSARRWALSSWVPWSCCNRCAVCKTVHRYFIEIGSNTKRTKAVLSLGFMCSSCRHSATLNRL